MKKYFNFSTYFVAKENGHSYHGNLKDIKTDSAQDSKKVYGNKAADDFGFEDEIEEQRGILQRDDIENEFLIDLTRYMKEARTENEDYKIPIKDAEYEKNINQGDLNCIKIGGTPVFIPEKEKLKNWALKSYETEVKINDYLSKNNLNIVEVIENFQTADENLKQMIIDYVLERISYAPLVLNESSSFGYTALPISKQNCPLKTREVFKELVGDEAEKKINTLINSDLFDKILNTRNEYSKSNILPWCSKDFDEGVSYFKHGNPFISRPLGSTIYKDKKGKNSTFFMNADPFGVSYNANFPIATISEKSIISTVVENCIDECSNKKIKFLTLKSSVSDVNSRIGHALAYCFKLENGKINGIIFNNTNRALSKDSFYFYLYPVLRDLNANNLLTPKMSQLVRNIDISISKFFRKNNLKYIGSRNNILKLFEDKDFDYAYEDYCDHKDKEGFCNYDLNIKMQGQSGFCLEGSYEVGTALSRQIARSGYPKQGQKVALKKSLKTYHRMPNKTFGYAVRGQIKSIYRNVTKNNYGSISDLKIFGLMSRVAIYQKSQMMLKFHRNAGNIVDKKNLAKFYQDYKVLLQKVNPIDKYFKKKSFKYPWGKTKFKKQPFSRIKNILNKKIEIKNNPDNLNFDKINNLEIQNLNKSITGKSIKI